MAGTGADPNERQGRGTDHCHNLAGRAARTWEVGQEEDTCAARKCRCRGLGGLGTDECGQWQEARISQDQRRENGSSECVVHVDFGGDTLQPIDPGAVLAVIEEGQGEACTELVEVKVALTACMRKFLTILNAMMRDKVPFRQTISA